MDDLSSRGVRVRQERVAAIFWALLAAFIVVGSAGTWTPYAPGIWAPTLINTADIARNVALYVPFGIFGLLTLGRSDARGVARVTVIAMLFSLVVEGLQLYTADRVASLTDIVSAAVGTVAGGSVVAWWRSPR
jgi:glycopeptide antibiotics resistance protein